ncbi:MAG: hypothetical protein KKA42_02450, partial [candidate division Zixibacteria bacterium]|nr:hypothetical protein [candidate division Zixibacteria bacterium]
QAIDRALACTGFGEYIDMDSLTDLVTVTTVTTIDTTTPFIHDQVNNRRAWKVSFSSVTLTYWNTTKYVVDEETPLRSFDVYVDSASGRFLKAVSRSANYNGAAIRKANWLLAEASLNRRSQCYVGLLDEPPPVTLADALDSAKFCDVPGAMAIVAVCVLLSYPAVDSAFPVWDLHMYGSDNIGQSEDWAVGKPAYKTNHMRVVINARTGAFMFASNSPEPE